LIQNAHFSTLCLFLYVIIIEIHLIYFNIRPPKNITKPDPVPITDDEEEEDSELIEAKIVLRDVSTTGTLSKFVFNCYITL